MAALIFTLSLGGGAHAQIRKEDNFDTLDQTTSWVGGAAPGSGDIAQWDNQLSGSITADLGADLSWQGIRILNPAGVVGITGVNPNLLTLGAAGIDMGAATQNLTLSSGLVLGSAQTWNIALNRTLQISSAGVGSISGTGPLTIQGPGRVRLGGLASTYTFTGGITLNHGTGLTDLTVVPGGAGLITNANLIFDMAAVLPAGTGLNFSTPALTSSGGGTVHSIGGARTGSGTPAWVQSSALNIQAGNLSYTQSRGSSARVINQISAIARSVGGTVNFRDVLNSDGGGNANTGGYRTPSTATVMINGIVPYITYTRSTAASSSATTGTSWFASAGTSNNGSNYAAFTASTATSLGTDTQNSTVVTDVDFTGLPAAVVNSIRFNDPAARTVTIDPLQPLTIGAGAILVTNNGSADHTITGGKLLGGNPGSGSANDLIIHQHNSTSTFTIASEIADNLTPTALTKTGAGKLAITGTASYTGPTFVNGGTLLVNGSLNTTPSVTVHRGGTLGGSGSVPVGATIQGTLAPGVGIGNLATGPLAFAAGATLAFEVETGSVTADKAIVTGGVTTSGGAVNLTLSDPGSSVELPVGTKLTLVDYSTTWPGTDLLTYQGATVANLSTIAFGANIYTVNYNDAAIDGTALTLTAISTPYKEWINGYLAELPAPADREETADPDQDGRDNFVEFALNGNPSDASDGRGGLAFSTSDTSDAGTQPDLSLTLAVRNNAILGVGPNGSATLSVDGLVYIIEASQDLVNWTSPVSQVTAIPLDPAPAAGWTSRTFQVTDSNNLPDKRFIRVRIVK